MAQVTTIEINTAPAKKSIADLEQELDNTNKALKQLDVNSVAFADLQKQAASLKGQLDQVNKTTDTLSKGFQGWGENLAKVTSGIGGGITAVTAGMQLMGVENENVVAGIAKLQQLMAFTQGISSMKDLAEGFKNLKGAVQIVTKSMNGLKGAIIGTGIGALVVALGLLIENWDKVTAAIDEFIGSAGDASVVTAGLDASLEAIKKTIVAVGGAIVNYITTPFKAVINAVKAFNETDGDMFDKLKAAGKAAKTEVVNAWEETKSDFKEIGTATAKAYNDSIDKQNKEAAEKRKAERQKQLEEQRKLAKQQADAAYKAAETALKIEEERNKRLEQTDEERLNNEIAIENKRLELIKNNFGEQSLEYEQQLTKIYELQQKLKDATSGTTEETTEVEEDPVIKQLKDRVKAYEESLVTEEEALQKRQDMINSYYEQGKITAEEYGTLQKQLDEDVAAYGVKVQEEAEAKKQAIINNSIAVLQAGGGFISDLLTSIADEQDQNNKEGFEKSKKLQIAAATINMLTGITTAISGLFTTKSGPWDIALAAIQAASIAAAGAANIAKIKKQQYNSSSSSNVSASVRTSTITPPAQYTQAVQNANIESKLADTRVYVVESDINKTGRRVTVQETENTY